MKNKMFIALILIFFISVATTSLANVVVPPLGNSYNYNYFNPNQNQYQYQSEYQLQNQSVNNRQVISPSQSIEISTPSDTRQLTTPDVRPMDIPVYQNGDTKWGFCLDIDIDGITCIKKGEIVVKPLKVIKGIPCWRVRAEDVLPKIIDNKISGDKVRYFLIKKGAVLGLGFSPGGAATAPVGNGIVTGSAPLGFTSSTSDDEYYITFVEVK